MNRARACAAVGCLIGMLLAVSTTAGQDRVIRVALVLYDAPSNENTVADPFVLGTQITEFSQMPAGETVYLEAWVSTEWPHGLTGAGLDVVYDPGIVSTGDLSYCVPLQRPPCRVQLGDWSTFALCPFFDHLSDHICNDTGEPCTTAPDCKTCAGGGNVGEPCTIGIRTCSSTGAACATADDCAVCVNGPNDALPCAVDGDCPDGTCEVSGETCQDLDCPGGVCEVSGESCDSNPEKDCVPVPGVVQNIGGNNLSGLPASGLWERIATIAFDVVVAPTSVTAFLAAQDEAAVGGGGDLMLTFWGGGEALPSEIQFSGWAVPGGKSDVDRDGILDALDNCPNKYNPGQEDDDGDESGNVCDNCPNDHNIGQDDCDGDEIGDACDDDIDDDGILNEFDMCDFTPPGGRENIIVDETHPSHGTLLCDLDGDCDCDLDDFAVFESMMTGPSCVSGKTESESTCHVGSPKLPNG